MFENSLKFRVQFIKRLRLITSQLSAQRFIERGYSKAFGMDTEYVMCKAMKQSDILQHKTINKTESNKEEY